MNLFQLDMVSCAFYSVVDKGERVSEGMLAARLAPGPMRDSVSRE